MPSNDPTIVLVFGFLIGLVLFGYGFQKLRLKQRIENTPTSKVRSIAMGPVEVSGSVVASFQGLLEAPFTGSPCVYYRYSVEEYRKSGKNDSWVTVESGQDARLFLVKDDTGEVLVDSKGAEVDLPVDFSQSGTQAPPKRVQAFLEKKNIHFKGWLSNKKMRFMEYHLAPGDVAFVTGEAGVNPRVESAAFVEGYRNVLISKGKSGFFFISDKSEKSVLDGLNWHVWLGILGGMVLGGGSLALLLSQWKLF